LICLQLSRQYRRLGSVITFATSDLRGIASRNRTSESVSNTPEAIAATLSRPELREVDRKFPPELPMQPRRILFHLTNLFSDEQVVGGAELGTLVVMKALRSCGIEPYVVMHGHGYFAQLLRQEQIPFEVIVLREKVATASRNRLLVTRIVPLVSEVRRLAADIASIIERFGIHIVHANHQFGYLACGLAARRKRIPCIWHLHEGWDRSFGMEALRLVGPRLAHHVISIAPYEQSTVRGLTCRVNHSIVEQAFDFKDLQSSRTRSRDDVRREFGVNDGEIFIGYISHLAPYKGQRTFVRAFARLLKDCGDCRAAVIGGPRKTFEWFRDELKAETRSLGIANRLAFGLRS
jgi:glycosyltransferase involved in cell wall biosynthesis